MKPAAGLRAGGAGFHIKGPGRLDNGLAAGPGTAASGIAVVSAFPLVFFWIVYNGI
jgi:hypothetical protein